MANATIKQKIGTFVNAEGDEQVNNLLLKPTNSTRDSKRTKELKFWVSTSESPRKGMMVTAELAPVVFNLKKPAKDAITKLVNAVAAGAHYEFGECKKAASSSKPEGASSSGSATEEDALASLEERLMARLMEKLGAE